MAIAPALLLALGGGAAAGTIGRLGKHVIDTAAEGNEEAMPAMPNLPSASAGIPVPVSPEEAAELRRKGIKVRQKLAMELNTGDVVLNAGLGAAGLGAAYGGWKLVDSVLGKSRRKAVESERDRVKARIQAILNDAPTGDDLPIHAAMKTAEEAYFAKQAAILPEIINTPVNTVVPLPLQWAAGAAGLASAVAAYRALKSEDKNKQKIDAYRDILKKAPPEPARAVLEPVEIVQQSGSPAQQAAG